MKKGAGAKHGPKSGSRNRAGGVTVTDWFNACQAFSKLEPKPSHGVFLRSGQSPKCFAGNKSQCTSFGQRLKQFKDGNLPPAGKLK